MPDARGHDTITVFMTFVLLPIALCILPVDLVFIGLSAFLFSALAFNPDLDLPSEPYHCWGFLRWIWIPYQKVVPHRAIISHGPLLGTFFRLLYLSPIALLILVGLVKFKLSSVAALYSWFELHQNQLIAALAGLELNTLAHLVADIISTKLKRTF